MQKARVIVQEPMHQGHDGIALWHHQRCVHVSPDLHESAASLPMFLQQPDVLEMHIMRLRHFSTLLYIVYMLHHVFNCSNCSYIRLVCDCKGLGNLGKSWEILGKILGNLANLRTRCPVDIQFNGGPVTCFATLWAKTDFTEQQRAKKEDRTNVQQAKAKSQITRIAKGETCSKREK